MFNLAFERTVRLDFLLDCLLHSSAPFRFARCGLPRPGKTAVAKPTLTPFPEEPTGLKEDSRAAVTRPVAEQDARRRSLQPTVKERALAWWPNLEGTGFHRNTTPNLGVPSERRGHANWETTGGLSTGPEPERGTVDAVAPASANFIDPKPWFPTGRAVRKRMLTLACVFGEAQSSRSCIYRPMSPVAGPPRKSESGSTSQRRRRPSTRQWDDLFQLRTASIVRLDSQSEDHETTQACPHA